MSISGLMSMPEEYKKVVFEHILQQANKEQRKMVVNSNYINQHLARENAIKLRALEINNFLSDVETGYDYRGFEWCGVSPDYLDIAIEYDKVVLSYEDGDWDQRSWIIPFGLLDMSDKELVEYVRQQSAEQFELDKKVDYARLRRDANALGYRLVPIEDTGE